MTTVQSMAALRDWLVSGSPFSAGLLLCLGLCIGCGVLRLLFGKDSGPGSAVLALVPVTILYAGAVLLWSVMPELAWLLPSLPFLAFTPEGVTLTVPAPGNDPVFTASLMGLYILCFGCNLLEAVLPRGRQFLTWLTLRLCSALGALGLYAGLYALAEPYLHQWAGAIVAGLWLLIALLAVLKWLLDLSAGSVNPLLKFVFSFFFVKNPGLQLTRAILTCLLALGAIQWLYSSGFAGIAFLPISSGSWGAGMLILLAIVYLFALVP